MTDIINPTIDLFLYDLRNSLGDNEEDIEQKRQYFYQKFHQSVREKLKQDGQDNNQNLEVEYVHLLKNIYAYLDNSLSKEGYYYPVRLGDSYGLLLEVATPNQTTTTENFTQLKAKIQQKLGENTATLGQTWMLSAYLPNSSKITPEEIEKIAQECYKAIFPDAEKIEFEEKGELIGANIFEYSDNKLTAQKIKQGSQEITTFVQTQHTIIAIYPDKETFDKLADFYVDLMRLFCYHHKIIWAYGQTRVLSNQVKNIFSKIQTKIESIEPNITNEDTKINKLQEIGKLLSELQVPLNQYTKNLNNLKFQQGTIEINLENYNKRLKTITDKTAKKLANHQPNEPNIKFLEEFSELVNQKYLLQITKDLANFDLGLKLLEDNIKAIRSQVEIEKAKSDRNFQELIAVIGGGLAIASLAGDKEECESILGQNFIPPIICQTTLAYKLILVLIASVLVWFVRRKILKRP